MIPYTGTSSLTFPRFWPMWPQFMGMSRRRIFWFGRPRCLRNCLHRQIFSSTWPSSPKGTRRCMSKNPLRPRRCLGSSSSRAPSPTTLRFLLVWVGSTKRTQIGKSTRWRLWWPTSPLPYPISKSLPPLPMQHAAFGALGFPDPELPIVAPAVVPPASLSKTYE
jgi:hypothetical protein